MKDHLPELVSGLYYLNLKTEIFRFPQTVFVES